MKYIIHGYRGEDRVIEGDNLPDALKKAGIKWGDFLDWETWYEEWQGNKENENESS